MDPKNRNLFSDFFSKNSDVHVHNTRKADDLHIPFARTHVRKFSTKINGALVWNSIPILIRQSKSVEIFKRNVKVFLITKKSKVVYS